MSYTTRAWYVRPVEVDRGRRLLERAGVPLSDPAAFDAYRQTPLWDGRTDEVPPEVEVGQLHPDALQEVDLMTSGGLVFVFAAEGLAYVAADGRIEDLVREA